MTLIRNGKINDVPMMAGVNLDECALFLHGKLKILFLFNEFNANGYSYVVKLIKNYFQR